MGFTCFCHLSELFVSCLWCLLTREEPDLRVLELSSGQHLIQVTATSAAPLESVLNLQICQVYNLGTPAGVCKADLLHAQFLFQRSGNPSVTGTCSSLHCPCSPLPFPFCCPSQSTGRCCRDQGQDWKMDRAAEGVCLRKPKDQGRLCWHAFIPFLSCLPLHQQVRLISLVHWILKRFSLKVAIYASSWVLLF